MLRTLRSRVAVAFLAVVLLPLALITWALLRVGREDLAYDGAALGAVLAVAVISASTFGWLAVRQTYASLHRFQDAARRIAAGDLELRLATRGTDGEARLADAFNTMTEALSTSMTALRSSRDELESHLVRMGETLASTHDLNAVLSVALDAALVAVRAEGGAVLLLSGDRKELVLKAGRNLDGSLAADPVRVRVGEGVVGRVARDAQPMWGSTTGPSALALAPGEPAGAESVVAVPLRGHDRVLGVLVLYNRVDANTFDEHDVSTIQRFARQASIAVENVLLHQEAQRLSVTDPLTGAWNYRYFAAALDTELERMSRFSRAPALLIIDLDEFKRVNDVFGHQRGDAVLQELVERLAANVREVDVLARYGGEEFVVVLPETDLTGAVTAAAKLCELVRERPFGAAGERPVRATASIGVAVAPDHGRTAEELVRAADAALYRAKRAGRDRFAVAGQAVVDLGPAREGRRSQA